MAQGVNRTVQTRRSARLVNWQMSAIIVLTISRPVCSSSGCHSAFQPSGCQGCGADLRGAAVETCQCGLAENLSSPKFITQPTVPACIGRWCGRSRSDGMFNVNGEIRVVGITVVLHGRFRGYRCHGADYQVKSAIVRALGRIWGPPQARRWERTGGRMAELLMNSAVVESGLCLLRAVTHPTGGMFCRRTCQGRRQLVCRAWSLAWNTQH